MLIDQRRRGISAVLLSGIYVIVLFMPDPLALRVAFGVMLAIGLLMVVLFMPMPRWRQSEARLRLATRFAYTEAAVIAGVATVVKLAG